jgi:hypothetical protein
LQGDGAVTGASAPDSLAEFRSERCGQRVTRSATSLGAGIPIIQVDEDRESRHQDNLIAVAAPDGDWSRCRGSGIITLASLFSGQFCRRDKRPGNLRYVLRCLSGILNHCAQSGA